MPPANVVTTTLRYLVDQASVKAAVDANSKVAAATRVSAINVGDVFAQAATKGKSANDVLTAALGRTVVTAKDATDAYAALERQVAAANRAAKIAATGLDALTASQKAAVATSIPPSGSDDGVLGVLKGIKKTPAGIIGSQLRMLPSVQIPGLGIGTDQVASLIRFGGIAQGFGVSLTAIGAAAGIAAPFVIGAALALKEFNDELENSKKSLEIALAAQDTYYKSLATSTTSQAQTQIEALKQQQSAIDAQIRENQNATNAQYASAGDDFLSRLLAGVATSQLKDRVDALSTEYNTNQQSVDRLTEGVKQGTFAINDRIEAEKKLAEANRGFQQNTFDLASASADAIRQRMADLLNQQQLNINESNDPNTSAARRDELKTAIDTNASLYAIAQSFLDIKVHADAAVDAINNQTASTSQLQSLLDKTTEDYNRLNIELNGLQKSGLAGDGSLKLLGDQIDQDKQLIDKLVTAYLPLARLREDEANTLKLQAKNTEDIKKANADIARLDLDHAHTIDEAYANAGDAETKAYEAQQYDLNEAQRKAGIDEKKAQEKYTEQKLKDAEDYEKKRAKIEREYARSAAEAIQDRDAVSLDKAQTKRADDLKDLNTGYKDQKKATRKALDDQLRTINDGLAEQQRVINHHYDEQFKAAEQALQKALYLENYRWTTAITLQQQALDILTAQSQAFVRDLKNIAAQTLAINAIPKTTTGSSGLTAAQVAAATTADSAGAGILFFNGKTIAADPAFSRALPSHALGLDYVPHDNYIASLHRGERIMTAQQNRPSLFANHSSNVNIYLDGQLLRSGAYAQMPEVHQFVEKYTRGAFWAYNRGLQSR